MTNRPLPAVTPATVRFWTGGSRGELVLQRCPSCGYWLHPPGPVCPRCFDTPEHRAVSGDAVVHTFTVNHQPWLPDVEVPYVVAIVELPEQHGLRLTTNIVGCAPGKVRIGMAVHVTFEQVEDVFLPLFRPVA